MEATCVQEGTIACIAQNRMSLENLFYATQDSIYTRRCRSYWKVVETNRRSWKGIEAIGIIWKSLENARTVHK